MTRRSTVLEPAAGEAGWREMAVIVILAASVGMVMLDRFVQLFLGPYLVRDLALKPSQIGLLAGVVAVCWAVSGFIGGALSDRVGRKRILVPAMVAFSLLSWLSGLARNFEEMLLVRALLGMALGPCWTILLALAEAIASPHQRGRNVGILIGTATLFGGAFGPLFSNTVAEMIGWRDTFLVAGVPGLVLAAFVAFAVREPPRDHAPGPGAAGLPQLLRMPQLWLCFAGAVLFGLSVLGFVTFLPLYVTQILHFSPGQAGIVIGATGLGGFFYSIACPVLSDRIGRKAVILLAAGLATLQPLVFLITGLPAGLLALLALLLATGSAIPALLLIVVPVELAPRHLAASAIGFVAFGSEAVGSTTGPIVGGYLADRFGLAAPILLAAAATALIAVIAAMLPETKHDPA